MAVKIGEKFKALQPFAGAKFSYSQDEECVVTANNIDDVEGWLRGGLVVKTVTFPEPKKEQTERPEQTNENLGVLPDREPARKIGRGRFAKPTGS